MALEWQNICEKRHWWETIYSPNNINQKSNCDFFFRNNKKSGNSKFIETIFKTQTCYEGKKFDKFRKNLSGYSRFRKILV